MHALAGLAVDDDERRAQRLVPGDGCGERRFEPGGVEQSVDHQRGRHVVRDRAVFELRENPQPALRGRQRIVLGVR